MFKSALIIGVGLMGGSVGLALKKYQQTEKVVGFDRDPAALDCALNYGAIDAKATNLSDALTQADLIVIATHINNLPELFTQIETHANDAALVIDILSVKASPLATAKRALKRKFADYIPCHPIAGKQFSGATHADADLFLNKALITTEEDSLVNLEQLNNCRDLWQNLGAKLTKLQADQHDAIFASTSHLPQLASYALMAAAQKTLQAQSNATRFIGTGFDSMTRLAASNPEMWATIARENAANIIPALNNLIAGLSEIRINIEEGNTAELIATFSAIQASKQHLSETEVKGEKTTVQL